MDLYMIILKRNVYFVYYFNSRDGSAPNSTTYGINIYAISYGKNKICICTGWPNGMDSHITPTLPFHTCRVFTHYTQTIPQDCTTNDEFGFLHCWLDFLLLLVLTTKRVLSHLSKVQSTLQSWEKCVLLAPTHMRAEGSDGATAQLVICAWNTGISDGTVSCWRSGMGEYRGRSQSQLWNNSLVSFTSSEQIYEPESVEWLVAVWHCKHGYNNLQSFHSKLCYYFCNMAVQSQVTKNNEKSVVSWLPCSLHLLLTNTSLVHKQLQRKIYIQNLGSNLLVSYNM